MNLDHPVWLIEGKGKHGPWYRWIRAETLVDAMRRLSVRQRSQVLNAAKTADPESK